ncbi:AAA family ATPase [Myxococcus landrumensis]|uniref:AAA family ATPase n=1 Tax=Myxococcus landrumensis TaxID=2813577 RepID=A0ABX7NIU4_9BACT|nr:AAA family ATPase [Myxococcus landrumus]QSQ17404.1 AAA family ATPase [Myxococcus landrumus]
MTAHLHVITGGPGSGKSSLIQALAAEGLRSMPEAGRAIIQQQVETGGDALPWADRIAFAEKMFRWELRTHREARAQRGPVILDRGLPDVIGYLRVCGLPVPPYLWKAAKVLRYHRRVFIAPHWPDIYAQDTERKQDPTEAKATCLAMREVYTRLDYELVPLPLTTLSERVRFVRSHVERG